MQEKQNKNKKFICKNPFQFIEIRGNGECYPCCMGWTNSYSFGNIFKQSFDEIWNSERAIEFRKSVLDGTYRYCDLKTCLLYGADSNNESNNVNSTVQKYPSTIEIAMEKQCNVRCIMCRDVKIFTSMEEMNKLDSMIEPTFIPLFKNCKMLIINGDGEALASKHSRKLLKRAIEVYPDMKLRLMTNGLICNEKVLTEAGIINNVDSLAVSIHATTKKTYDKIVKDSNFDEVMKNVKWLAKRKNEGKIKRIDLIFVISQINYKEAVDFAKMCKKLNVQMQIFKLCNFWGTKVSENFDKYAVFEKTHPEYNKFVKVINNPIFKEDFVLMPPEFRHLKPVTFSERFANNIFFHTIQTFIQKLKVLFLSIN